MPLVSELNFFNIHTFCKRVLPYLPQFRPLLEADPSHLVTAAERVLRDRLDAGRELHCPDIAVAETSLFNGFRPDRESSTAQRPVCEQRLLAVLAERETGHRNAVPPSAFSEHVWRCDAAHDAVPRAEGRWHVAVLLFVLAGRLHRKPYRALPLDIHLGSVRAAVLGLYFVPPLNSLLQLHIGVV